MSNGLLLDTNIIIAILNKETSIDAHLAGRTAFISSTVMGELHYGAYKSSRVTQNRKQIEEFVAGYIILPCDGATGELFGQIKAAQEAKGRKIPENDYWIAASAYQHDLILVTRDEHFNEVDNLMTEKW
jgi:tRNA(fMet)-specific endonuclease VapC